MAKPAIGDEVKVLRLNDNRPLSGSHKGRASQTGIVMGLDDSDNTAYVRFADGHAWFCWEGLEVVKSAVPTDTSHCSCNGPEKIVMILFQPVRVCTVCKKEKG